MSSVRSGMSRLAEPRTLAWCAALLAVAALLSELGGGSNSIGSIALAASADEDGVDPLELAQWIREDRRGLRVIDIRDTASFNAYGVLTATNVPLAEIGGLRTKSTETLVFYGDGDTPAAQTATLFRVRGYRNAYYLRGGLLAWVEQVMQPELRAEATPEEREAFRAIAELSRWFGGLPRTGIVGAPAIPPRTERRSTPARPVVPLRRGCAR